MPSSSKGRRADPARALAEAARLVLGSIRVEDQTSQLLVDAQRASGADAEETEVGPDEGDGCFSGRPQLDVELEGQLAGGESYERETSMSSTSRTTVAPGGTA